MNQRLVMRHCSEIKYLPNRTSSTEGIPLLCDSLFGQYFLLFRRYLCSQHLSNGSPHHPWHAKAKTKPELNREFQLDFSETHLSLSWDSNGEEPDSASLVHLSGITALSTLIPVLIQKAFILQSTASNHPWQSKGVSRVLLKLPSNANTSCWFDCPRSTETVFSKLKCIFHKDFETVVSYREGIETRSCW